MWLRILVLLLCSTIYSFAQSGRQDYLDNSLLPLPTNGSKVRTPLPLAPYVTYRIEITSPYNLKPIYSERQDSYETDIQIDGKTLRARTFNESSDGHLGNLEFLFHGHGKPIYIGFGRDYQTDIESAQIHIYIEGRLQKVWRQVFSRAWNAYGGWVITCLLIIPIIVVSVNHYRKWIRNIRAEEKKEERERQALVLNTHNKGLELMREIERKAQQKAQELIARNYDEMQKKIMYWRSRAYTESYFLNPELRHNFAVANKEKIVNELEKKWAKEFIEIAQDLALAKALREQEPGVMHWIQARQEVVNIAHKLSWTNNPVIDAYFEEMPDSCQIIIADEFEEAENPARSRARSG